MAFLPVPITAIHTTDVDYCFGEGMMSRFSTSGTFPAFDIVNDSALGRVFRIRRSGGSGGTGNLVAEIDIPAGVTGLTFGLFHWNGSSQSYTFIDFLNASNTVCLFIRAVSNAIEVVRGSTVVGSGLTAVGLGGVGGQHYFEGSIEFDDATGRVAWRANNGSLEIDETNIDTLDAAGPITKMRIRHQANTAGGFFGHGYVRARDGTDNFWGRGMYKYHPYGEDVGDNDWTAVGTGTSNNDRISETDPDGDTTHLTSETDLDKERMDPPDVAISGAIRCLWNYQGSKQDGASKLHSLLDAPVAGEEIETEGRSPTVGSYGGIATAYETDPDDETAWTEAKIEALNAIGFQLQVP
jgi:hypothetical protein